MEYCLEEHERLWDLLYSKLKPRVNEVAFLELNKDIFPGNKISIPKDIPLPIRQRYLVEGIKTSEYADDINMDRIIECMVYIIGCDKDFRYNQNYISIIRGISNEMENYLQNSALKLKGEGHLLDALIYHISIDRIYDYRTETKYNMADVLRELALEAEKRHNEDDYELYYMLSFYEFHNLSKNCPGLYGAHYYLGFYYSMEKQYDDACREWEAASITASSEDEKEAVTQLLDSLQDNMDFEKGKDLIEIGSALEGIKLLIPLMQKYKEWNELKYYTALGYRKLNNYMKAKVLLLEVMSSGEVFPEAYNELGLCYFNLKMPEKAVESFEKAAAAMEDEPSLLCNLGIAYYEMGDTVKAKERINKAYNLAPDDELTQKCKKWSDNV